MGDRNLNVIVDSVPAGDAVTDQSAAASSEDNDGISGPHSEENLPALECLVKFLSVWTTKFPYDFRDERIMSHVKHIVAK